MDKIILKITGIITLVLGIFYSITIIGLIVGVPLIIGGSKFIGYSNMTDERIIEEKNSILGWSIFFLFFTVIGGILGLIYYFSINGSMNKVSSVIKNISHDTKYLEELEKLKELYDKDIITKEEFEAKKKQILDL